MANYKYRFPSMVVAIIDLAMTFVSIYLLVMFFLLAFTLTSCLFNERNDCSSVSIGGGGFGKGLNLNFEESSISYSKTVITSDASGEIAINRSNEDNNDSDEEQDNFHNNRVEFGKSYPEFGFDNRNRDSANNKEIDLNFGSNFMDLGTIGNSRNTEGKLQPDIDFSFGRNRNQNQKPSGFEWFKDKAESELNPKHDFLKIQTGDKEADRHISSFRRILFIIVVVVLWAFFAIAVIVEIVVLIAAIQLLKATRTDTNPGDAARSANCWRICSGLFIVLFVLNFFGGSGQSNFESIVVGCANVLFRVIGLIVVSLYIGELQGGGGKTPQNGQVYYDIRGNGEQIIPMNDQGHGGQEIGRNEPKQV